MAGKGSSEIKIVGDKVNSNIKIMEIGFNLKYNIKKSTKSLPENFLLLVVVKTKNYTSLVSAFLDIFTNDEKKKGIYLTTNKAYDKIKHVLEKEKNPIDFKKVFFIDCMGKKIAEEDKKDAISAAPQNLTELNLIIDSAIKDRDVSFIIVDSLSTFFIYNQPKEIEKFIRSVITKLNDNKVKGVFITNKTRSNESAIDEISLFFDETLEMSV
ncbi:MAG: ATPase domain-containing protein [Candidatus Diapherotrites archaeon]